MRAQVYVMLASVDKGLLKRLCQGELIYIVVYEECFGIREGMG